MTEFSASALLKVELDQSSLHQARQTLEDEIGAATAEVSASDQIASGGSSDGTNASAILEDNLGLNQERNDILRDILDATEMEARNSGNSGRLGSLGGGALAIGGGAIGLVALFSSAIANTNWSQVIGDAIPDLDPGDVVDKTKVTADDLIDDAADIGEGDVVEGTVQAADIVGNALPVDVSQVVASSPLVTAAALIAEEGLPVKAADLVGSELPAKLEHVVGEDLPVAASDVVKDDLPVGVETILASAPLLTLSSILAKGEFPIKPGDIFGSGDPSGDSSPTGDGGGGGDLPVAEAVGSAAVAAGLYKSLGGSGALTRLLGTSSGGAVFTPGMFEDTAFGDLTTDPEDIDSDKPTLAEIVTGTGGGDSDPSSSIDGNPVNFTTSGDGNVEQWVSSIRQSQSERTPAWRQMEPVTVGGDGSNRNDTDRQQEVRVNGNVSIDVSADRSVEKQLRRQGVPDWVVDAVEEQLTRRVR